MHSLPNIRSLSSPSSPTGPPSYPGRVPTGGAPDGGGCPQGPVINYEEGGGGGRALKNRKMPPTPQDRVNRFALPVLKGEQVFAPFLT